MDKYKFQKDKVVKLNSFFMKNVLFSALFILLYFVLAYILMMILLGQNDMSQEFKISVISMVATFVITTSKSVIDKVLEIVTSIFSILSAEQEGLNKSLGVDLDLTPNDNVKEA